MEPALVAYSSSDDDEDIQNPAPVKKRKLPSLSVGLTPTIPVDNPTLHQGRIRTTPHVEGQFAAHVYVAFTVGRESALGRLVEEVVGCAGVVVPGLWEIGGGEKRVEGIGKETENDLELHISLSRPTYMRAHQREEFKRSVKAVAKRFPPFKASFATFAELTNDEQTRIFLTMEVGAGHLELTALTEALTPALNAIRQKAFYADPRFHASVAWASRTSNYPTGPGTPTLCLPPTLLPMLNGKFGARLAHVGVIEVGEVSVKIGKDVVGWALEMGPVGDLKIKRQPR